MPEHSALTQERLVYSASQLPAIMGLSLSTIERLLRSGELPARKAGTRTIILREDVEAWLRALPRKASK